MGRTIDEGKGGWGRSKEESERKCLRKMVVTMNVDATVCNSLNRPHSRSYRGMACQDSPCSTTLSSCSLRHEIVSSRHTVSCWCVLKAGGEQCVWSGQEEARGVVGEVVQGEDALAGSEDGPAACGCCNHRQAGWQAAGGRPSSAGDCWAWWWVSTTKE